MRTRRVYEEDAVDPAYDDPAYGGAAIEERGMRADTAAPWSPAQLVGLVIGLGFVILGVASLVRTGFPTDHLDRPQALVWHLPHSPLLGAIDVAFGALLLLASVVPGGVRSLMTFLGVVALGFGLVVVLDIATSDTHRWLGVTHRNGWLYVAVGAVVLVASFFAPVFFGRTHSVHYRRVPA